MVGEYWRQVAKLAAKDAAAVVGITSRERVVIWLLIAVVTIAGLAFIGSPGSAWDEIAWRGFFIAVIVLAYPFIFLWKLVSVPAREYIELYNELDILKAAASARENQLYIGVSGVPSKLGTANEEQVTFYRIVALNTSRDRPLTDVIVRMVSVSNIEAKPARKTDIDLALTTAEKKMTRFKLNPGEHQYLNILHIQKKSHDIYFGPFDDDREYIALEDGWYNIDLIAFSNETPPVEGSVLFNHRNSQTSEFRDLPPKSAGPSLNLIAGARRPEKVEPPRPQAPSKPEAKKPR